MKVIDILASPWAIVPEKYTEIREIYSRHVQGLATDLAGIEARLGKPLNNAPPTYVVQNGVAVLPVEGVISKRMSLFHEISGGASTEALGHLLSAALSDPSVHSIALAVDSPGGQAQGVQEFARQVKAARAVKPIVAVNEGTMASAAYWIGSAAERIFLADDTVGTGSIGVVTTHLDTSKAEEARGIKVTEITAGKYKRIASQHAPLSDEGRAYLTEAVDEIYTVFVDAIAENRGVSTEDVLSKMADGKMFIGKQAIKAGLADASASMAEVIALLNTEHKAKAASAAIHAKEGARMTAEEQTAARLEGAKQERERIAGIQALSVPGHEKLIADCIADHGCSVGDAAIKMVAAQKAALTTTAANLKTDAPKGVASTAGAPEASVTSHDDKDKGKKEPEAVVAEAGTDAALEEEWKTGGAKLQGQFIDKKDFFALRRAEIGGKVRVFKPGQASA